MRGSRRGHVLRGRHPPSSSLSAGGTDRGGARRGRQRGVPRDRHRGGPPRALGEAREARGLGGGRGGRTRRQGAVGARLARLSGARGRAPGHRARGGARLRRAPRGGDEHLQGPAPSARPALRRPPRGRAAGHESRAAPLLRCVPVDAARAAHRVLLRGRRPPVNLPLPRCRPVRLAVARRGGRARRHARQPEGELPLLAAAGRAPAGRLRRPRGSVRGP